MKKIILITTIAIAALSCGPSAEEQKAHEESRQEQNQELEEEWADDLEEMLGDSI